MLDKRGLTANRPKSLWNKGLWEMMIFLFFKVREFWKKVDWWIVWAYERLKVLLRNSFVTIHLLDERWIGKRKKERGVWA
jgi:hypothetical protein